MKPEKFLAYNLIGIISIYTLCQFLLYFIQGQPKDSSVFEQLGLSGDFFGGIIGTLISGATLWYLIQTFELQKKELNETKNYLQKQNFESTFFKMLDMINTIGMDFVAIETLDDKTEYQHSRNNFYKYFIRCMAETSHFRTPVPLKNNIDLNNSIVLYINEYNPTIFHLPENAENLAAFDVELAPSDLIINWAKDNEETYSGFLYMFWYYENGTQLGHLFRYVFNAMKFSIKERKDQFNDENYYIKLIQAQLSNHQLAVMFYSGLSPTSLNKTGRSEFKDLADDYENFQNIDKRHLLNPDHYKFYPKTHFKFRNGISYNEEINLAVK